MPRHRSPDRDRELKLIGRRDRRRGMDLVAQRYWERLTYHALCIVKDPQEASDAVQEVFIKAMRERRFFEDEFQIRAWLFRVTTNLCYNIVRDKRRRSGILATMPEESVPQGRTEHVREAVYDGEIRREMMGAMAELSPMHREILLLRYYSDLSYAEIAAALEIRLGTVMSRLSRARSRLGEVLGPEHPIVAEVG